MKYTSIRFAITLLIGAVLCSSAHAGFGSHGGSYGSSGVASYGSSGAVAYGSYGSSGGSSGGAYVASYASYASYGSSGASSGGSSGRPGLFSRLHTRIHAHIAAKHARHAAYGSSGHYASSGGSSSGGYLSHGSSGGSSGGYHTHYHSYGSSGSVSYGSSGSATFGHGSSGSVSYGSSGSVSYGSTGASYGSVGSVAAPYYGASNSSVSSSSISSLVSSTTKDDAVRLNVSVPESAVVYVNDRKTTSTGANRQFVSRGLQEGKSYRFEIRAELNDGGKVITDTQTVVVTAGSQENIRFALQAAPKADEKIDTAVVLNVPENAEVTLAGNATKVAGTTRVFKTSQLKAGEVWDDYVVQVKVGDQVKSQSIRLIAGDKLELSFDFGDEASRLASR